MLGESYPEEGNGISSNYLSMAEWTSVEVIDEAAAKADINREGVWIKTREYGHNTCFK